MALFTESLPISIGAGLQGLALRIKLFNVDTGVQIGSDLTVASPGVTIVDEGNGDYTFTYNAFDDAVRVTKVRVLNDISSAYLVTGYISGSTDTDIASLAGVFTETVPLKLGISYAGLTLRFRLFNSDTGLQVGSDLLGASPGVILTEEGNGDYTFTYNAFSTALREFKVRVINNANSAYLATGYVTQNVDTDTIFIEPDLPTPLFADANPGTCAIGDSIEIYAYLRDVDDNLVPRSSLASVSFKVEAPDESSTTASGIFTGDGTGFLRFTGTTQPGSYTAVATFTYVNARVQSVVTHFEVIDLFHPPLPSPQVIIGNAVWDKLEDLFDSEDGGPWLRDQTLNFFAKEKMPNFINEALFDINVQHPPTNIVIDQFVHLGTQTLDSPLLIEGTYLRVVLHIMRSYIEQPAPTGAQVVYEDRRDYTQRWLAQFEVEWKLYLRWLALWKRKYLRLGESRLLVATKQGRLIPAVMRSRGIGRGYY